MSGLGPKPIYEQEVAWSEELTDLLLRLEGDKEAIASILRNNRHPRVERAECRLRELGYEDRGGEHWKPPIGKLRSTRFQSDEEAAFWQDCVLAQLFNGKPADVAADTADVLLAECWERQKP